MYVKASRYKLSAGEHHGKHFRSYWIDLSLPRLAYKKLFYPPITIPHSAF